MHKGEIGAPVADLQRRLGAAGLKLTVNAVFDAETEAAVMDFQRRAGLIADGIAGAKTLNALLGGDHNRKQLSEADMEKAAARLGVPVASIKAVNQVESAGAGFLPDGRAKILYERHVMYRQLAAHGMDSTALAAKFPAIVNQQRGGYIGGPGEYARLAEAAKIHSESAREACSWGQFQIMGYHWNSLGYESIDAFETAMNASEAAQLDAFIRFIESDPALYKALKGRKWAEFARLYNGPSYKENLYDIKLARAYERFNPEPAE